MISVVIPLFNEEKNVEPLLAEVSSVMKKLGKKYEVVVVDDGSKDATLLELRKAASQDHAIKVVSFSRNFGQTAAFAAGIESSIGDTIVTIDGDLENDPHDIPTLLGLLDREYDLVSGWRQNRWKDQTLTRKLPSRVANWLISRVSGVKLHDYGCMLKAYRRSIISDIVLYGEMHRFIPAYAHQLGARIGEVPVNYRSRRFGKSKYGISRTFRVLLDLVFIKFFTTYISRPIHFFGGIGLVSILFGVIAGFFAMGLRIFAEISFVRTPLPTFSALLIIVGVQLMVMGVLAEMIMRTYYESQRKTPYKIKEKINL